MTEMIETRINGRWTLTLPEHRAARAEWSSPAGWERARWDSIFANVTDGDVVIDVGTEEGDLSALLASWVGPTGRIVLMEPNPRVWPNIRAIFQANGLDDGRVAEKWVGFAGPKARGAIIPPHPDGWPLDAHGPIIGDHGFCVIHERPDLPVATLDAICETHGLSPTLITMDVEGAELEVLHGAGRILSVDRPLVYVSVHHDFMRDSFGRDSAELWTFMGDLGYEWERLAVDHEDHVVWWHPDGRPLRKP